MPKINFIKIGQDCTGYFKTITKEIFIDINKTRICVDEPFRIWSYTGNKTDKTTTGVLCHEFGHYIDDLYNNVSKKDCLDKRFKTKITSYEPNTQEVFAETFRLFLTNPDLLRVLFPDRHDYIRKFGFKNVVKSNWEETLVRAHPKLVNNLRKRIKS
jgi:hypothetical protein